MACLYSVMLPWQQNTRQLKYQNTEVYLFILCYANFGDPGINGFGKIENATQVSKTVFSHLKVVLLKYIHRLHIVACVWPRMRVCEMKFVR